MKGLIKTILLAVIGIAALILIVFLLNSKKTNVLPNLKSSLESELRSQYKDVKVVEATFQEYDLQKFTIVNNNKTILLQVVKDVDQKSANKVINQLESKITDVGKKNQTLFDPYLNKEVNYSIPEEFNPIKEETLIKGNKIKYYIIYANEIFSYYIFAKEQAKFKGVTSVFPCKNDVYKVDIFSDINAFDKSESISQLNKLYCI